MNTPYTREYAIAAIDRLNARRTGKPSFDMWLDYAIRQWREYLLGIEG